MIPPALAAYSEATSVPGYVWLVGIAAALLVLWIGSRAARRDTPGTREHTRVRLARAEADAQVDDYRRRRADELARERAAERAAERDHRRLPPGQ